MGEAAGKPRAREPVSKNCYKNKLTFSEKYCIMIVPPNSIFFSPKVVFLLLAKILAHLVILPLVIDGICVAATSHVFFGAWSRLRTFLFFRRIQI